MKHRIKILISLLFVIATLTTSLHEMLPGHDSTECQVCTFVQNDIGLVSDDAITVTALFIPFEYTLYFPNIHTVTLTLIHHSRAPPLTFS